MSPSPHVATPLLASHPIVPLVVSEARAVAACLRFMDDHRAVAEPACGATATAAQLQAWGNQFGVGPRS